MYFLIPLFFALLQQGTTQVPTPPTAPPQQQQTAQPAIGSTTPGMVHGHVYAADTGLGVKHADVTLRPSGRFQPQDVSTDAQGGFEFRNVDPGTFTLSCNKSGFVASTYGFKANQPAPTFTVRDSQDVKDIDCRMQRGGVITGVVTNDEGEPVVYANVQVMQKQYRRGQATLSGRGSAQTDDRGRYRIFDLSPGRYYVQATRRGAGPTATRDTAYQTVLYPTASRLQDAQVMLLTSGGEVSGIDMVLKTVATFTVSGKVIDTVAGHPVTGGNVNAMSDDVFQGGGFGGGNGNGQIKADGTFQLKGLMPGRYRLQVMSFGDAGGRGGQRVPGGQVPGPGAQQAGGPRMFTKTIDVGQTNIQDLVIAIGPGSTVKGKISADGGTLPDNMRINMVARSDAGGGTFRGPGGTSSAQLAADGTFEIADVQSGSYDLQFNTRGGPANNGGAPGNINVNINTSNVASGFFLSGLTSGGQDALDTGVVVPEGGTIVQITAVLDFRSSSITGRALNEAGDAMAGVPVVMISADPKKRLIDRYFKTTFADSNGNYKFSSVIPGSYLMVLWPEGDSNQVQDPDLMLQLEKQAASITVERAATATKDLKMTSELRVIAQTFAQ